MGVQERRERERAARRSAVLDAARALVCEKGFNGTTTKEIAARCELSEATLFWYFKSKDEILLSLLFEGIDYMARGIDRIAAKPGDAGAKLERLWRFFSRVRREHPEYLHVFTYLAHPQSTSFVTPEIQSEIARRSGDNMRRIAALLANGEDAHESRLRADLLWAAFVGLMVLRDTRKNLGAKPHPTSRELDQAFAWLRGCIDSRGGAAGDTERPRGRQEDGSR